MRVGRRRVAVVVTVVAVLLSATTAAAETVRVTTLPPVPGAEVSLGGQTKVTDSFGAVSFEVDELRGLPDRIVVDGDEVAGDDRNGPFRARYSRLYAVDNRTEFAAAFDIERPVEFTFTGARGLPVRPAQIDSVELKNDVGAVLEDIPLDRPIWLSSVRVVSTNQGPETRQLLWSVRDVRVRDSGVVSQSDVRFEPELERAIEVPLLFFTAEFSTRDAFFGYPVGDAISLTYPDGEVRRHELDSDGRLTLASLPRGEYQVVLEGPGLRLERPVTLTRDQDVDLKLFSWIDIALVVLGGLVFLSIPVAIGHRRRRARGAVDGSELAAAELLSLDDVMSYADVTLTEALLLVRELPYSRDEAGALHLSRDELDARLAEGTEEELA